MKKLIALILVLLFCGSAMAATVDWSSMTDDEINAEIAAAQAELESRGIATEEPDRLSYEVQHYPKKGDNTAQLW